ncbi:MAG: isoprenylcysteine carboxylmethyltransferase family protein [Acidobacteriota bacterium]
MSTSALLYLALVVAIALERVGELLLTRRNLARLKARGGKVVGDSHYPAMVAFHTSLLIAAPLEVFLLDRPFLPWLGWPALAVVVVTMALRYWAITTLGDRWTTRVVVVPGEGPVTGGPYRFLRHPNYLAVIFEVAALPLVHSAWIVALLGTIGNALVLRTRIGVEEKALQAAAPYFEELGDRSRFVPGGGA